MFNHEKQERILKELTNVILNSAAFAGIELVGLSGSVGREEKAATDSNLNDLDFFVVAKTCKAEQKLKTEKELRTITGTVFTDILFIERKRFRKKLRKEVIDQFLYDLLKGCIILHGKEDFCELMKKAREKEYKVTYKSSITVLLTRLWCLTGPYIVEDESILPIDEKFTSYQMKKAFSAIVDAALIYEKSYSSRNSTYKITDFKKTDFYQKMETTELMALMEFYERGEGNFTKIYPALVKNYLFAIRHIIRKDISKYANFPLRKLLLGSLIKKDKRLFIKSVIKRYHTLQLINEFYQNGNKRVRRILSGNFKDIYSELIK